MWDGTNACYLADHGYDVVGIDVAGRAIEFDADLPKRTSAWLLLARHRAVPAQPPTVWTDEG